ncbi:MULTISPECIES: CaiB/BaiF CoA-transferase family protein [unclassified Streptomyces]|uniref:CaiB/BaiF CoA transferase family protein n=1 Tax=unclassified Streptomyces TaxID=2593676 RepID=UPI0006F5CC0E|nr:MULTISPECIES: CaiB/BaiF CoA-transferase family protein [unclassified Streptomyces]KQX56148.1 alpha-methylacyl-CoA racemase [Streptomyces sp. Root1304]KRA96964.1 alpha-methylacyl-CoA racemase [Streptomyces sp. Root66D1]
MAGPLTGVRVLEFAGSAPTAFVGTVLSGLGADVVRVDRAPAEAPAPDAARPPENPLSRGHRSVALDLKSPEGVERALALAEHADILVEGFRPGVADRLGIGPEAVLARNPRLVYGRVSGWGQRGEWAGRAAHDLAVLALTGALDTDPATGGPVAPPTAYLSSFAGGAHAHVHALLAALHERERSGRGQVVDTALADGAALIATLIHQWREVPGNHTVTDAPHYSLYRAADGRHLAVAAIEPRLYANLLEQLGLAGAEEVPDRTDPAAWPALRALIAERFAARDREHWVKVFDAVDAGVAPVLTPAEAARHHQLAAREAFVAVGDSVQPAPASRFGRTPADAPGRAPLPGEHTEEVLAEWRA